MCLSPRAEAARSATLEAKRAANGSDAVPAEVTIGKLWRENSLSIVFGVVFLITLAGQTVTGWRVYNGGREDHGRPPVGYAAYLTSGHSAEATFENWESEFLQMAAFVVLTVYLRQKGSAESRSLEGPEPVDEDPRAARDRPGVPWPVRRGGLALKLYENSLGLAFLALFLLSFALHAAGGAAQFSEDQVDHGGKAVSALQYVGTSQFWFESLQNWQSEFLSIGAMVAFTVFLRQRGSPQSKPVATPNAEQGT